MTISRLRVAVAGVTVLLTFAGCSPDALRLVYKYDPDMSLKYRMTADANANWDILGHGAGSYRVVFDITENIRSAEGGGAIVDVTLSPVRVTQKNLPPPGSEKRSFSLHIGPSGEVLEVLEVNGVPAADLDPDELSFIGTYRPPLPLGPVGIDDTWKSEQKVALGSVSQTTVALGTLETFDIDDAGPFAQIGYSGRGPLVWSLLLPQGEAQLSGSAASREGAILDIDRGLLRRARSSTHGEFKVDVSRPGAAPLTGTLDLELNLDLELVAGE